MTTDDVIMEEMLERATDPTKDTVDELAIQMFCMIVRNNVQLLEKAHKSLLAKIHSNNMVEAIRAIALLEEAMAQCGSEFQDEVAKFRFLNEFIRLLSKNYQGGVTPMPVKKRLMECLLLWTTLYPQKTKIKDVYEMLKKEGTVEHGPSSCATVPNKKATILGEDGEIFEKLIQSGDQVNFKKANLLLQARFNQEVRRNALISQHKSELQEMQNTVVLLDQMLDTYIQEGAVASNISDTLNLMRELYMACKKHRTNSQRLCDLMESINPDLLGDSIEVHESLEKVLTRYNNVIVHHNSETPVNLSSQLSTASTAAGTTPKTNTDLLAELLNDTSFEAKNESATSGNIETNVSAKPISSNSLDEINDIFGPLTGVKDDGKLLMSENNSFPNNTDILSPVNVFSKSQDSGDSGKSGITKLEEKRSFRELREIDELSRELLKESLPDTEQTASFKKPEEKLTLNDLVKQKQQATVSATPTLSTITAKASPVDHQILLDDLHEQEDDDIMLQKAESNKKEPSSVTSTTPTYAAPIVHLSDINIDLDDIAPIDEEHILCNDDDIEVKLNFTENRPSKNVSVIVITVLNKSKLPIKEFQFEASAKKPNKVRLLPPSANSMEGYKPFRPPIPINQVMLLLNPTGKSVDVTCIIGYKLGDDPDPIKESIIAKNIPFVE